MTMHLREVGRRIPQHGAPARVQGQSVYTQDVTLPGMLHAAVLRSPHAHARILRIDTGPAKALAGVHAVITAADFPGKRYVHLGGKYSDRFPLATDRVRFYGEEVAAVAAETAEIARDALRLIAVEYAPLRAVLTPAAALSPDAPGIHAGDVTPAARNIAIRFAADYGDVAAAFDAAAHVFDEEFAHGVVVPACMETNSTVAHYDRATGDLTLWTATQAPFMILGWEGWRGSLSFQGKRKADIDTNSIWYWGLRHFTDGQNSTYNSLVGVLSPLLILAAFALSIHLGRRYYERLGTFPWIGVAASMLAGRVMAPIAGIAARV